MKVKVSRKAHFNAAHRLYRPEWSFEKNDNVFGLCNNPNFHGHNYELIVSVTGEIDEETGFVIDMKVLKDLIREKIEKQLDHKNLNVEVEWFKTVNPTAENIVVYIWNQLRPFIKASNELEVVLYETPRNYVTFSG
ncbi:MAG: 6-carboxytetrahydropterin synthase [Arenibacter sp.]|mgnify:FL=1|jgi:6-pyruvoyltetrahydropterin/6-carboxytetrahydropterin synthase|uniref:6-carboxy-5,6,7,8-tetrahydropterin synthase n=1 Tax=Arenibacter echinorum TaxID=440515 RepID=A0A327QPN1_9FLAO|nr:6-carboxytetrahydropterin synthase [Arenibacter echinorum]RAJ05612.1 6-pyruvoyltetrahydropterin/6-carboxytetrahydropterin synthase [Arenibacter echinorum]